MNVQIKLVIAALVVSSVAMAQDAMPSVMPFTLEVKRVAPGFSKKDIEELKLELPRHMRIAKLGVPTTAAMEDALVAVKRQDCDRDDACLQQLAQKAETLYALYVSIDLTLEKNVVALGRVVSDEGALVRKPVTVSIAKGKGAFGVVAREALNKLLGELELTKLPTARAVAVPPPVVVVPPSDAPVVVVKPAIEAPPPMPPMVEAAAGPTKIAAYVTGAAGVAVIIAGGLVALTARPITLIDSNVLANDAPFVASTKQQQAIGLGIAGAGLAACLVSGALLLFGSDSQTALAFAPLVGGGAVSVGGTFQ